ncbi:MAG TPA: Gfo/Idh/MocA family oxidoreductase [Candidatus Limnocylindrales bacterium]
MPGLVVSSLANVCSPSPGGTSVRYAIVGTGHRAQMWARELSQHGEIVALADPNPARIAVFQKTYAGVPGYSAEEVREMLAKERVDVLVVTSVDATHDAHIVTALEAGCDVITEKPMTTTVSKCRRILEAQRRTGKRVTVAFNYRYHPAHAQVKTELARIGEIGSVHFEWLLDTSHGADYFRRWHRDRANSGGLLVHKATHHFDLVNWWLGAAPEVVTAQGRLFFYGKDAGSRHGYARDYERAHGAAEAEGDPFALDLNAQDDLRALYLEAEHEDGYHRDQNVFGEGVDIEDDMAVLVRYDTGATMSYHLTAYSPWEGYRIAFNGSKGRLELDMSETQHVASLRLHEIWQPGREIPLERIERGGHGGADTRMVAQLAKEPSSMPTALDGARSILTGLAANESIATARSVRAHDLLDLSEYAD